MAAHTGDASQEGEGRSRRDISKGCVPQGTFAAALVAAQRATDVLRA